MTDRTVVYRLRAEAQQFSAQMKAAGASVGDAANKMTAANAEGEKFRRGLDSLGGTAGKIGLVAAAGLGAAVLKAANFDQAMSNVQAATHESAAAMESLREAALKAGADTAFSASEAAAGIENLAKAGISTEDILGGALAGALDLAAAGGMEVADAAEAAAGAMAQFKLEGSQATHVADLLAAGAGKAQGDVSDMVMALKQAGTVSAQTGLTIEETTGSLAAMAEQSLLGSDAGTSFKTMLAALTPNSKKAADAMEQYNIHAFDAQGNFVGMTELAGQLRAGLGGLTDEQRAMTLETIFGSDAVRAAAIIYDNGAEGIQSWIDKTDDAGYAAQTAGLRLDNLKGDVEALGGSIETALIGVGDSSQGPLRALTQGLTATINDFSRLPDAAQTATAAIMAGSALIGGSVWAGSKVVQGIANTGTALENLGISSGKATKAMKGLAAAGAGLAALAAATVIIRSIQAATDDAVPSVEALTGRLIDLANLPAGFSGSIGAEFNDLADSIDRMTDKSKMDAFADTMQTPFVGMFGEAGGLRQARADIDALDEALAGMVTTGNADIAADALENLADQYGLSEAQVKGLMSELDGYDEALKGQANDAELAGDAQKYMAGATDGLSQSMAHAKKITEAQAKALKEAREAAHETASSFVNLGEGVDDAKVSLGQWITQMANQADALNNFMNNAKTASKRGLRDGLIQDLQDAGTAGALRMKQLANATDEEIARANRAWKRGQDAMQDYVNFKVPPKPVDVNTGPALSAIAALEARLRSIRDEDVFINVRRVDTGLGPQTKADGGYIAGPGTATSDSIPAYLSNGEYVVKAAAVQKYGVHMFDRLNAMHFAGGGSVGPWGGGGRPSSTSLDTGRLTQQGLAMVQLQAAKEQLAAAEGLVSAAEDQQRSAEAAHDAAVAQRDAAGRAAVAGFDTGLFDRDSNVWAAGAGGGWRHNLGGDIAGLTERQGLISQAAGQGITGTALAELFAQGSNSDISGMIARGELGEFASMFGQREALQGSVAQSLGDSAFGANVAQMAAELANANTSLQLQTTLAERASAQLERANENLEQMADRFANAINGASAGPARNNPRPRVGRP